MDTSHLVVGRLGPNLRPRQQIQNRRPGALRSQARRGARDVSRTDGPDRAEQSDEFIGLLAHEVARTRRASRFPTSSIVRGVEVAGFRIVVQPCLTCRFMTGLLRARGCQRPAQRSSASAQSALPVLR